MQETNTPENNVTPIDQAPSARFNTAVDQALDVAKTESMPVAETAVLPEPELPQEQTMVEAAPVEPAKRELKVGRFAALVAAGAVVGTALFGGHGKAEEKPVEQPTVQIEAPTNGTAWDLAREVKDDDASQREVSTAISEQADSMGYPGVEAGEVYTLPKDLVSEEAANELAPEEQQPPQQ